MNSSVTSNTSFDIEWARQNITIQRTQIRYTLRRVIVWYYDLYMLCWCMFCYSLFRWISVRFVLCIAMQCAFCSSFKRTLTIHTLDVNTNQSRLYWDQYLYLHRTQCYFKWDSNTKHTHISHEFVTEFSRCSNCNYLERLHEWKRKREKRAAYTDVWDGYVRMISWNVTKYDEVNVWLETQRHKQMANWQLRHVQVNDCNYRFNASLLWIFQFNFYRSNESIFFKKFNQ